MQQYISYQQSHGHSGLTVAACGFFVSQTHPYLGASPDGVVYDPSCTSSPFGFLWRSNVHTSTVVFHLKRQVQFLGFVALCWKMES